MQINDPSAGWRTFLTLRGVAAQELDTALQADISGGLATACDGDFLWYLG
ncbi:MAG: hypothetical protein HY778_10845 [Betaproteobacteria bacterium]|nr:hypothetical protein [Betaproteobacteria bacterium]